MHMTDGVSVQVTCATTHQDHVTTMSVTKCRDNWTFQGMWTECQENPKHTWTMTRCLSLHVLDFFLTDFLHVLTFYPTRSPKSSHTHTSEGSPRPLQTTFAHKPDPTLCVTRLARNATNLWASPSIVPRHESSRQLGSIQKRRPITHPIALAQHPNASLSCCCYCF